MPAFLVTIVFLALCGFLSGEDAARPRPLMRDFVGLNVHSANFKPELYAQVTHLLRDYHPVKWDLGEDTSMPAPFPRAKNGTDWGKLYGAWKRAGYRIDATLVFDDMAPGAWKDMEHDAEAYGQAVAKWLGPSTRDALLDAVEIGDEPGKHDDATYRRLFESIARGVRAADPALRIATCAMSAGPGGRRSRNVDCLSGLDALWDILTIHCYAEVEAWPTWRRSSPEDPATGFVGNVKQMLKWRDKNAPAKELWVTEFGYDAGTKQPPPGGDFARWQGITEEQQAKWTVRSFLLLARLGVDRAYLYLCNDSDEPRVRGSSGITRNFEPKPAFHALAWMQRSLGEYRFLRVEREDPGECFVYEFAHGADARKRMWAIWKPAGESRTVRVFNDPWRVVRAERMPLIAGDAEKVAATQEIEGFVRIEASERPVFVWLEKLQAD